MYCLNMLVIALELATHDPAYEDIATKFFEHFVYISAAINKVGGHKGGLWHAEDGYYYDVLRLPDGRWSYQSLSTARGLFRLAMPAELRSRTIFTIREGRIVPELFTADDGAASSSKDQELRFDWNTGRVTGVAEKRSVDLPLQPGLLDTMSVQIALMQELLVGNTPRYFVIVDKDRIDRLALVGARLPGADLSRAISDGLVTEAQVDEMIRRQFRARRGEVGSGTARSTTPRTATRTACTCDRTAARSTFRGA